jgi:hypothetical protein
MLAYYLRMEALLFPMVLCPYVNSRFLFVALLWFVGWLRSVNVAFTLLIFILVFLVEGGYETIV